MIPVTEKDLDAILEWWSKLEGKKAYHLGDGNVWNGMPLIKSKS
jgi:hypothetical protein